MTNSWWNTSYSIRRNINIINESTQTIVAGNPISLILDNSKLNRLNKIREDFDDIEILFWDYKLATPAWTVLARETSYDSETDELTVIFNLVYDIQTQDILNYFIYYANPSLKNQSTRPEYESVTYARTALPGSGIMLSRPTEDWSEGTSLKINARAAFTFYGTNAVIFFDAGNDKGIVELSVDDGPFEYIDLYSNIHLSITHTLELDVGKHYVRFRVTGDKNPSSSGWTVDIVGIDYSEYISATQGIEEIFSLNDVFTLVTGV